jgi:hypothetical protein
MAVVLQRKPAVLPCRPFGIVKTRAGTGVTRAGARRPVRAMAATNEVFSEPRSRAVRVPIRIKHTLPPGLPACYPGTPGGLLPSDDTYIDGGSTTKNYGSDTQFTVRPDNGADRRGLVRFDLSAIPANAAITSATLYLYENGNKTGQTTYIYRVTSSWNESTVTWDSWSTPGGDFDSGTAYFAYLPEQGNCMVTLYLSSLVERWTGRIPITACFSIPPAPTILSTIPRRRVENPTNGPGWMLCTLSPALHQHHDSSHPLIFSE